VTGRDDTEAVKGHLQELSEGFAPFEAELKRRGTPFYGGMYFKKRENIFVSAKILILPANLVRLGN